MVILYKLDNNWKIREWSITKLDYGLSITYGIIGGTFQTKIEHIPSGLANRSLSQQIESRFNSRITKQLDRGYKFTIDEARKGATNTLGLLRPMLAKPIQNVKNINFDNAFVQYKFDGHRCLITRQKGRYTAYSRGGKVINTINHILEGIILSEGQTIDGELYCHGESLQTIGSWIKRVQPNNLKLKFHLYDIIEDSPYVERFRSLRNIDCSDVVELVKTVRVSSEDEARSHFIPAIDAGYEGLILRQGDNGYMANKRDSQLLKIKSFLDDEFQVIDIKPSKDGWAILVCLYEDKTFDCSAPGTMADKQFYYERKEDYINRFVNIKFPCYTPGNGIPFQPIATRWLHHQEDRG